MDGVAYTEEFHKLNLRSRHVNNEKEKVSRYLNGLRFNIQDEINLLIPKTVDECFQVELRAKQKLKRKHEQQGIGRGRNFRGRGSFGARGQSQRHQVESSGHNKQSGESNNRGGFKGRSPNGRGRFNGLGRGCNTFSGRCYNCNQVGHRIFKCLEKQASSSHGGERRNQLM